MSLRELELLAPAKINWGLAITGRRADGYHLLRSLMHSVSLYDTIRLRRSAYDDCHCQVQLGGDNLALRAWLELKREAGISDSLLIEVEKKIPTAAGLAGGSADAAAVLLGANQLFELGYHREQLCRIGLRLGMDLPFCLHGGLALVEGAGESITPLPNAPGYCLALVNPGFPVSTPQVYAEYDCGPPTVQPDIDALRAALFSDNWQGMAQACGNALYPAAVRLHPQLQVLERQLAKRGLPLLMSGSGGSFWLLSHNSDEAQAVAEELAAECAWAVAAQTLNSMGE